MTVLLTGALPLPSKAEEVPVRVGEPFPAEFRLGVAFRRRHDSADTGRLIRVDAAVVPPSVGPGGVTRVHLLHRQFELEAPPALAGRTVEVPGYTLYYVCQEADGVCLFRRQDFVVPVGVSGASRRSP